jgi:hypothetical protein
MTLNIMVLENEPEAASAAAQELRDAGHTVLTCHESDGAAFPCRGLVHASKCPLRSHPVDVALVVRSRNHSQPTLREDGARCALVHRVPLVVAGAPALDPYDNYATRMIDHTYDVVDACEQAAQAPIESLGRRATEVTAETLHLPASGPRPRAEVTRREGRLAVHVLGGESLTKQERSRVAVRIAMALRELDPFAAGIDIAIEPVVAGVGESPA